MISFIDKQFDKNNFKVWLYTPGNQFLGELVVDRPVLNLQLEGLSSTFSFTLPENIETALIVDSNTNHATIQSVVNPRINESLDQFQVEVWYGDLDTDNFQKQRFIIVETPRQWNNDITSFSYKAYSKEYENIFFKIIDWPGVEITEFVDQTNRVKASGSNEQFNLAKIPKDERLIRVEIVKDFIYRLVQLTANAEGYQFGSLQPNTDSIQVYKFVEQGNQRLLLTKGEHYEISEDEFTGLKHIVYNLNTTFGGITLANNDNIFIDYKLEDPVKLDLIRSDSSTIIDEYNFFYDNNNNRITCYVPSVPLVFQPLGVQFYENAPSGSTVQVKIFYETTSTLTSQDPINKIVVKDGLRIEQVFESLLAYGDEDSTEGKWTATFVLQSNELRSNLAFNNTNLLVAIDQTLKTYDAIALPDTINKIFYIYDKSTPSAVTQTITEGEVTKEIVLSSYRQDTGLSFEYGKFLKSVSQEINAKDIVTVIRGLGANNITSAPSSVTGYNEWEDYTWFLDGCAITNLDDVVLENENIELNKTSRWMSKQLTEKLLLWIEARKVLIQDYYQQTPGSTYNQYSTGGLIRVADEIQRRLEVRSGEVIALSLAVTQAETTLNVFIDTENKSYVENWTGNYKGNSYSGESGYGTYLALKHEDAEAAFDTKKNEIAILNADLLAIQNRLEQDWIDIDKKQFATSILSSNLTRYNFTSADLTELQAFRREGLYQNRFITKPSELFLEMQKDIIPKRIPRVEIKADIIGLLQTTEARSEWNKLRLGGLANLILDRLNIDVQIQIKEMTVDIDNNSTSITFSTSKDYIGVGQKNLGRFLSNAAYNLKNNLGYYEDEWNTGKQEAKEAFTKVTDGYEINNLNVIEAGGLTIGGNGGELASCVVNPLDDEVVCTNKSDIARLLVFGFVRIDRGKIDVFNRDQTGAIINQVRIRPEGLTQESVRSVVRMDEEGFAIFGKVDGQLEKQFFVDEFGNIQFAGELQQIVKDNLFQEFNITPVNIEAETLVFKYETPMGSPTPSSILLTANLRADFEGFFWEYDSGNDNWVSLNTTTQTFSVNPNAAFWNNNIAIRFRCTSSQIGDPTTTDFDIVTIVKLFNGADGEDGVDGLTALLTNEAHTLPRTTAGAITYTGSGTDILLFEGTTQLEYDGIGTANGKWTVTRTGTNITPGAVSKVGDIARVAQHSNMAATPASVTYTISGKRLNGETFSLTKIQSLSFAQQGEQGIQGPTGPLGPTSVFKGDWSNSATYVNNLQQRDIVYVASVNNYYILTGTSTSTNQNPVNGFPWTAFSFFQFIATKLNITDSSIVREDITVGNVGTMVLSGKNAAAPFMSINQPTIGYDQTGIFLGTNSGLPRLSLKSTGANFLRWNGSSLEMNGNITATSGTIGGWTIGQNALTSGTQPNRLDIDPLFGLTYFTGTGANDRTILRREGLFFGTGDVSSNAGTRYRSEGFRSFLFSPSLFKSTNDNVQIEAGRHIFLRAATGLSTGRIYIKSGLSGYTSDTLLRVPGFGGDLPSTKILKTDFEDIDDNHILNLFENINIVKYKDKMSGDNKYSFIIENELDNQNHLFASIIKREEGTYRFQSKDDIPEFLKEYIDTEALTINEEDGAYYFNPLVYDSVSLWNLAIQNLKINQKRITSLEERLAALEQQLNN